MVGLPDQDRLEQAGAGRFGDIRVFAEIDSTNAWLLARSAEGAADGTVAVADHQSAGRGRFGRKWEAPPGSALLCSALVRPRLAPDLVALTTLVAGVAMAGAVAGVSDLVVGLKWPNDLRLDDRKLGGILTEAITASGEVEAIVIGCGVNLRDASLPPEVADVATSLEANGVTADRATLLQAYLRHLSDGVDALERGEVDDLLVAYRDRCETVGRHVRAGVGERVVEGEALRIGPRGDLVVAAGGVEHSISHGEVTYLR
ncbi:MAG: biotin--[acetyl-CoA-carboxylase] ligase [Acidimicrobiia bacterium]|nr:biotin--[acetyl-CoA-carboxylase] ligase [Acidimicrobiia bacterium]